MSLNETAELLAESRKIIESNSMDPNAVLNMILQIVTNIDKKIGSMETKMIQSLNEMKKDLIEVSGRVRKLEGQTADLTKRVIECESSCEGVSNLFDQLKNQIQTNSRNITHQNGKIKENESQAQIDNENLAKRISAIEKQARYVNKAGVDANHETLRKIEETILDLQFRSMKNNLIFTNLVEQPTEDVERKLQTFIYEQLGIEHQIEFGNVHRFGKKNPKYPRPIVARFLYHKDLRLVLERAKWLKGTPYGIHEQFPKAVEDNRKKLYPIMKSAKRQGKNAILVRDKLFINGQEYSAHATHTDNANKLFGYRDTLIKTPKQHERPYKRQHLSDSSLHGQLIPETPH